MSTANIADLYKMQFQILKPLSPRQEYALIVLHASATEDDVRGLAEVVVRDYPHVARLYDAFAAATEYGDNSVPFIIPVSNSEHVTEEIYAIVDHSLVVAPSLRQLLEQALERVQYMPETADERRFVIEREPLTMGWFIDCVLDAYNCGQLPMAVRPSKAQQQMRNENLLSFNQLRDADMFSGEIDYTQALQPSMQARHIAAKLIARLQNSKRAVTVN
ncbi:hypothetical protein pEaSNUABM13_00309 [Erwinia phage pEa_SNUABM_13]|nr:hypothetical protein pEaSNUABM13_00309 [Erwinia phage pEa_SNUABM_13]QYW03950.1 hypothetical protein pEaSNUABM45_00307 [Erwinia phage pEa_SNUABM_45]QYW04291.1 hypothetical protein pEaSNUABM46_00307 [Erwinia phage pEa_SNUABM_46]QYW05322.1 hypothetical protein pEaSNUABM21_00308 [Erwinia phage pEa_SNUABM_21]